VAVRQGVAAGHLNAAILCFVQDAGQALIRSSVEDPSAVIDGTNGIHHATIKVHFLRTVSLTQVVTVAQAITKHQQVLSLRILIGKVGSSRKTITAGFIIHNEVILFLLTICHLSILAGDQVRSAAYAITTDDGDRLAAI